MLSRTTSHTAARHLVAEAVAVALTLAGASALCGGVLRLAYGKPNNAASTVTYRYSGTLSATLDANATGASAGAEQLVSTSPNANVALVRNGGRLTLSGTALTKSGDSDDADDCNFYGVNSVLLAVGPQSHADVQNASVSAISKGSNGIFAANQAQVDVAGTAISTTADNSRGLDATYGGAISASGMNISTKGKHSAALATDRGGGTVTVRNSTLATAGSGSPLIYSTGSIEVSNTTGRATGSQIACVEGFNNVLVRSSELRSTSSSSSHSMANGVLIYRSASGDAATSTGSRASFMATDSTLASAVSGGAFFYLTNTAAEVSLTRTALEYDASAARLVVAAGNSSNNWGTPGKNGAKASLTLAEENVQGDVEVDAISAVELALERGSVWSGAGHEVANASGATLAEHGLTVKVDATSTWTVTGDSEVTRLEVESGGRVVDAYGATVRIVDATGKLLVNGSSDVTLTVGDTFAGEVGLEEPEETSGEPEQDAGDQAKVGWERSKGGWRYRRADGGWATGWLKDGRTWYHLSSDGIMQTGWLCEGVTWYYLNPRSGAMLTGWVWDGSGWYYCNPASGAMLRSTVVEGQALAASGLWLGRA